MYKFRIYLDSCCFNRPFDDLSHDIVRHECEAVLTIIDKCERGVWDIFNSDVLNDEFNRIPDFIKKHKVLYLFSSATLYVGLNNKIVERSKEFQRLNIKTFDALHLASAEYGGADVLLTTDKKFLNNAQKTIINFKIANPAIWLTEVLYND